MKFLYKRRYFLYLSLIVNVLLIGAFFYVVQRLGGWQYGRYRLQNDEAGMYTHRKSLFEVLPPKPGAIVMLGDSQTEQCEWRELLGDSLPVLNRGISGDHTSGILGRLEVILKNPPAKIFLCVGVNDLILGKPVSMVEKCYRDIVKTIRKQTPDTQLVLISVLPVNTTVKNIDQDNAEIRTLNERIAAIAQENELPYVDVHNSVTDIVKGLRAEYTDDGIHLNGKGYLVWKEALEPYLK